MRQRVDIGVGPGALDVRYEPGSEPAIVFLHHGLGTLDAWPALPDAVRAATGERAMLAYSRHGYGRSAPVVGPRPVNYMHNEALDVLPAVLRHVGIERPILVGHSDGGSIAIIHAGEGMCPVAGLVLIAAHVFVEDETIAGIEFSDQAYRKGALQARLGPYHDDFDATFTLWRDIWFAPEFRDWNIESYLSGIECPVLVIQGDADQYGTLAQVDAIEAGVKGPVERVVVLGAGHEPHVDAPAETVGAIARFVDSL